MFSTVLSHKADVLYARTSEGLQIFLVKLFQVSAKIIPFIPNRN
jgi:hypothetical protein